MHKPVRYNFGQVLTHLSKTNAFYGRPSVVEKNVFFVDDTGFGSHGYWKLRHDSSELTLIPRWEFHSEYPWRTHILIRR